MRFQDIILIFIINCAIIYILHTFQKRTINESLKNLKKEIGDLENLVAAIIEEFEEIADSVFSKEPHNNDDSSNNPIESNSRNKPSQDLLVTNGSNQSFNNYPESNLSDKSFNNLPDFNSAALNTHEIEQPAVSKNENVSEVENRAVNTENSQRQIDFLKVKDPKHKQVLELWSQGLSIEEISKKLEKGRGEIQLVLGLYKRS